MDLAPPMRTLYEEPEGGTMSMWATIQLRSRIESPRDRTEGRDARPVYIIFPTKPVSLLSLRHSISSLQPSTASPVN